MAATASPSNVSRWQRTLLPGELIDGRPRARRTVRDWVTDIGAALIAAVLSLVVLGDREEHHGELLLAIDLLLGVGCWIALWFRRRWPVGIALVATALSAFAGAAAGPALVAAFSATVRAPKRGVIAVMVVAAAVAVVYPLLYPSRDSSYAMDVLVGEIVTAMIFGWGLFVRARRELVRSLHERAERLQREQELVVAQAREAERRRIAGEMHDVLAHRVSLLSVHAGALEFRPDAPPEQVAEAAGVIRASAHSVLQELREVIGVLRDEGPGDAGAPQPTLREVPALVAESRAAGARIAFTYDLPEDGEPPPLLARTAFRVVQEGLTNARKHAPASAVVVVVSGRPGTELVAEVRSRRPVGTTATPPPGWGRGLAGLEERVTLAGGRLERGPRDDGDFVLRAVLPWP